MLINFTYRLYLVLVYLYAGSRPRGLPVAWPWNPDVLQRLHHWNTVRGRGRMVRLVMASSLDGSTHWARVSTGDWVTLCPEVDHALWLAFMCAISRPARVD